MEVPFDLHDVEQEQIHGFQSVIGTSTVLANIAHLPSSAESIQSSVLVGCGRTYQPAFSCEGDMEGKTARPANQPPSLECFGVPRHARGLLGTRYC